ncbi:MAG TPA: LuxR C-terminal-related transcriptional regulator, partial [Thermoleophilaceae bacterium]|nr:LuxR C-terminal-related transcriptional regulator [Thermoleophilaceae bacterium]
VEWVSNIGLIARASLRLAQDRPAEAVADLRAHREIVQRFGWREFARSFPNAMLATALAAAGHKDEARELARQEAAFARDTGRHSCLVASLTALGRAQEGKEAVATLAEAVRASAHSQSPVIRARALVELGAALRRDGQRVDARERLREGGELAGTAGARLLQEQALEELSIAGARQRDPFSSGVDALTPSERRVAEHAARGMTNREIAETLFVTQKTIEVHLGNTYGKLGIRSRNQLQAALEGPVSV